MTRVSSTISVAVSPRLEPARLARIFPASWVARATRPSRRATGPAEGRVPLLAEVLPHDYSPSVPFPVGESPTGTGGSPVPPTQRHAGYEISRPGWSATGLGEDRRRESA